MGKGYCVKYNGLLFFLDMCKSRSSVENRKLIQQCDLPVHLANLFAEVEELIVLQYFVARAEENWRIVRTFLTNDNDEYWLVTNRHVGNNMSGRLRVEFQILNDDQFGTEEQIVYVAEAANGGPALRFLYRYI